MAHLQYLPRYIPHTGGRSNTNDDAHANTIRALERALFDWLVTTTRPATILPFTPADTPQHTLRYQNAVLPDGKIHPARIRRAAFNNYL